MGLRVLIIDEHPAVGRGLRVVLESMPELDVVGVYDCPARGLWHAMRTPPDVALVDAEMPGLCSSAVIRLLRARSPETRVVALGIYPERRTTALRAGAHAFTLKDSGYDALRDAIGGDRAGGGRPATDGPPQTSVVGRPSPVGDATVGDPRRNNPAAGLVVSEAALPAETINGTTRETRSTWV